MSTLDSRYSINGVISTDKTVLQNLEALCSAAGTWLTYDTNDGKWSFVINQAGTSVKSFDNSNIIGAINVSGSGLTELYNSVRVEFPHIDLNDQKDYVSISIPTADLYPNEPNNQLQIQYDIINNPVQAEMLGLIELKQSRVDKVITFTTDYSSLGLKAGDIIDITSTIHGFSAKLFRVVSIVETESDQGLINLNITALEYDSDVYDFTDLTYYIRTNSTGINTIGNIGIPGTPTITAYSVDARPRVVVESTAPTGLVESMELWYSTDVPPAVTIDANRTYTLLKTVTPSVGNVFAYGEQVDFEVDNLSATSFFVKTRGINSGTSGPFSDPSGQVTYTPTQVTDAVGAGTDILDDGGNPLAGLLAMNALMALLGRFFNNDASTGTPGISSGSLFDNFWKLFNTQTGTSGNTATTTDSIGTVTKNPQAFNTVANNYGNLQITASAGVQRNVMKAPGALSTIHTVYFTPKITGTYKYDVIVDQNTSGADGGRGSAWSEPEDYIGVTVDILTHPGGTFIDGSGSGGPGAQYWTDFAMTGTCTLTANVNYRIEFGASVSTASNPTTSANLDLSWNIYTITS